MLEFDSNWLIVVLLIGDIGLVMLVFFEVVVDCLSVVLVVWIGEFVDCKVCNSVKMCWWLVDDYYLMWFYNVFGVIRFVL